MSYPPPRSPPAPLDHFAQPANTPRGFDDGSYGQLYHTPPVQPAQLHLSSSQRPYAAPSASTYSLVDEKDEYGPTLTAEEDEVAPLTRHLHGYGRPPPCWESQGLSRKETIAKDWQRRQRIGRAQTKKVQLGKHGNLIAEYAVPTAVRNANKVVASRLFFNEHPEEFQYMRYTAATCDPDFFTSENGWSLRASNYGRRTDLLICITYYNEDKILLARTLHGVMENVRDMVRNRYSEFRRAGVKGGERGEAGGDESWKRIVVSLVFDGIDPADPNTLDVLACLGVYQDAVIKGAVNTETTIAHIFEYTTAISFSPKTCDLVVPSEDDPNGLVPTQFIFCLKHKNAKKINSHRWLFNGLSRHLQPDVCVLLDAGTKPSPRSIYYLWEAFAHNRTLGGACGEIHAMLSGGRKLLNPLVAAQNFEYKMSNILDKPTESSFGYVSVLPGAFSAYRFSAIQGRPLEQYFHGDHSLAERLGPKGLMGMSIFRKNMFLAEDRILCFELVAKANSNWTLAYVKPAKGETDVPEQAAELRVYNFVHSIRNTDTEHSIGQRRRWLNGSFAAGVYSLVHFFRLYRSSHNPLRMFMFHIQALYNIVNLILSFLMLGNFYLTFAIIINIVEANLSDPLRVNGGYVPNDPLSTRQVQCWAGSPFLQQSSGYQNSTLAEPHLSGFFHENNVLQEFNWALEVLYLLLVAIQIILALGNRPKGERIAYTISFWTFALLMAYLIFNTVILTIKAFCPIAFFEQQSGGIYGTLLGSTFGPIMAGLIGTLGIYIASSILYLDPWHILHSMPQYMLVAPSFTNILNVYAFCNLHDVSWGTKGSDKADALPTVALQGTGHKNEVEVQEKPMEDLDAAFKAVVDRARAPLLSEEASEKPSMDDSNKTFRTRLVVVWLFLNAMLAVVISRLPQRTQSRYFAFLLICTFALSIVRFCGFLYFMLGETCFRFVRLCTRRSRK